MVDTNVNNNGDGTNAEGSNNVDPSANILKRVSEFKPTQTPDNNNENKFNMAELDTTLNEIEDETVKTQMLSLKKSLISGENKKYQELAELRKALETQVSKGNAPSNWTTEKVQSLLNDPLFVAAAQPLAGTNQNNGNEDYSALNDSEKQSLAKVNTVEQQNRALQQQLISLSQKQQDESLKVKYPDYDSSAVDTITADLLGNKIKNTREHIWKAYNHDNAIKKAYQMGQQDAREGIQTNMNAASFEGGNVTPTQQIKREKNESNSSLLTRMYSNALKRNKGTIQT